MAGTLRPHGSPRAAATALLRRLLASISALLKEINSCHGQHNSQLLHIRTQTDQARGNWFPEFGFILQYRHHWSHLDTEIEVEALSHQYRIAAWSVEEATPGTKEASTFTCFRIAFIPFALTNFIRLKHCTQASSKMTLKVWSWVRILGPHKPNLWLCCMGSVVIPDRTQNGKL